MNHLASRHVLRLVAASFALFLGTAAEAQQLSFTPFHSNGIYAPGEKVGWTVTLPAGAAASTGSYSYAIKTNDWDVLKTGSFDLSSGSATIETSYDNPAMLHVVVDQAAAPSSTQPSAAEISRIESRVKALLVENDATLKAFFAAYPNYTIISAPQSAAVAPAADHVATLGAAVVPTKLQPTAQRPADFDAFWAGKLAALKKVPIRPVITSTPTAQPGVKLYTVTLDSLGSHVHGYLAKPDRKGKFPVLVIYQWAGVYPMQSSWATDRAAEGWLVFDVDSHDMPPDQATAPKNYQEIGNNDREKSYFLNMYLRDTRALDFVSTLPSWDRKTIVITGTSMGGQQSLVTAGLNPQRVTAVVVNEPSGADSNGELHNRKAGYPFWETSDPEVAKTALYFDTVNFALHIKAPTLLAVGFIDSIVLPAGLWTAFNQIPGPKEVVPMVESDHNNLTPQKQGAYLQRSEEVLATILHGGRFIPNEELSRPKP